MNCWNDLEWLDSICCLFSEIARANMKHAYSLVIYPLLLHHSEVLSQTITHTNTQTHPKHTSITRTPWQSDQWVDLWHLPSACSRSHLRTQFREMNRRNESKQSFSNLETVTHLLTNSLSQPIFNKQIYQDQAPLWGMISQFSTSTSPLQLDLPLVTVGPR